MAALTLAALALLATAALVAWLAMVERKERERLRIATERLEKAERESARIGEGQ